MKIISGEYIYHLNGEPTGVSEVFRVERSGRHIRTTSTRDASVYGAIIDMTSIETDGKFDWLEITMHSSAEIKAEYKFENDSFRFRRFRNSAVINDQSYHFEPETLVFPLMRVFQGKTILSVAANPGETKILVPFIEDLSDLERLLTPTFDLRTANLIDQRKGTRTFKYLSKHYDKDSEFHLGADELLTYYRFPQTADKIWEVSLKST